jgi:hypothetical protein
MAVRPLGNELGYNTAPACAGEPRLRCLRPKERRTIQVTLLPNGNLLVPAEDAEGNLLLVEIGPDDENYAPFLPFAEPGEDPRPENRS